MRLLITGSREWTHHGSIAHVIEQACYSAFQIGERLTVVHGAAKGADMIAGSIARNRKLRGWPCEEEPHPADWMGPCAPECQPGHRRRKKKGRPQFYCPTAGHRRNQQMVDLGMDLAVAFWRDNSTGTADCIARIEKSGVEPIIVRWEDRDNYLLGSSRAV